MLLRFADMMVSHRWAEGDRIGMMGGLDNP